MRRSLLCVALILGQACSAPSPSPPATSAPASTPAASGPTAAASPPATAAPSPEAPLASASPAPTAEEPVAIAPPSIPTALATAPPTAGRPAATAAPLAASAQEAEALAAAPLVEMTSPGNVPPPTAVVLPPSARLVRGATPTPDVVASSPALRPEAVVGSAGTDYARAIKLVQDARKGTAAPRLEERVEAAIARARATGSEVEILGWQAALKGRADLHRVTFMVRDNRQGLVAEWEADLATGQVRAANPLAEALDAL